LLMPIVHANSALFALLVPFLVRLFARAPRGQIVRTLAWVLMIFAGGALVFWGLLIAFAEPIMRLLYGGNYRADIGLLMILGLLPLAGGITGVFESALTAAGKPRAAAKCFVVAAVVTFTVGWWLLKSHGVIGAGWGLLAASGATALALAWVFWGVLKEGAYGGR
jgi:O-antigen/teichoic acid export membrane protein